MSSRGDIPRSHTWCSYCLCPESYGLAAGTYCKDHTGEDGEPCEYTGYDVYEPTDWVLEVVGTVYKCGWTGQFYRCFGYDRRQGFWMQCLTPTIPQAMPTRAVGEKSNVSERAIGRTYHTLNFRTEREFNAHIVAMTAPFGPLPVYVSL